MEHLIFLFNLVTLGIGLAAASGLFRDWRAVRSPLTFWKLVHFVGFSFTMVVAAVDAYALVNLGGGASLTRFWTALILVGCAAMLFAFPHLSRVEAGRDRPRRFSLFWAGLAAVPLAGAGAVFAVNDPVLILAVMAGAFTPFFGAIFYGLGIGHRQGGRRVWEGWIAFAVLGSVAGAEVWWLLTHPVQKGAFFLTLPLAYLYNTLVTWQARPRTPAAGPAVPQLEVTAAWAASQGLTPRETEVARGILRGLSNKELAFELGLSENTVRNHIANLYRKLGVQKRLDLVVLVQKYQGG